MTTTEAINPILQWLNANPNLAGIVTFLVSAGESLAIIGTIIPGTITMTAIGTLAGAGVIPLWPTVIWAIFGAAVGDNLSFWMGRYFKDRLRSIWPFKQYPQLLESGEVFFYKYGMSSVFIGRFIGPIRAIVPVVAGMLDMKPMRYVPVSVFASFLWASIYMLPGIILGHATLELPPDVAVHVILTFVLATLFVLLCILSVYKIIVLVGKQIDYMLNKIWKRLQRSRYFHIFTKLLKHHNANKTHGQLPLAFHFGVACAAFFYLATLVVLHHSDHISINNAFFHLFRSLRTETGDNIMLAITLAGDKHVLIPVIAVLILGFAWNNRWRTACHTFLLFALSAISIVAFKHLIHSERPWGILNNSETFSFPSGHTTIAMTFYVGLGLLLLHAAHIKKRWLAYTCMTLLVSAICLSRLYLGAHWFTDIMGGLILSAILLMFVGLSYNRRMEKPIRAKGVLLTALIAFSISYGVQYTKHFDQLKQDYTQVDWPFSNIAPETWWNRQGEKLPVYRVGRLGLSSEVFNLQWVDNLDNIKAVLLKQGWEVPPQQTLATIIHRLTDVSSEEHLPLVSPLYLDKDPVLVLTKYFGNDKTLLVLRLWNSNVTIKGTQKILWVGTIGAVPRTYSWLINYKKAPNIVINSSVLFKNPPKGYEIKQDTINVHVRRKHRWQPQIMILVKPKHIS